MSRKWGIGFLFVVGAAVSFGQDIHFTQVATNNMLTNPATTGMFNGWERVSANHKNQWVGAGTKYFTTSVAADVNFLKPKMGNHAYLGMGLQFYNDVGGDSKFGLKQFQMSFSGIVPVGEMHEISAGLQFGVGQRSGDLTGLIFPNQFNGSELDPSINSNEINNLVSFVYPDLGAGLSYHYGNRKVGFTRDDQTDFVFGVAYAHLNHPHLNYRVGYSEKLYGKLTIHANFLKDFSGTTVGIEAFGYEFIQGPHAETLLGALMRIRLSSGSKTTGLTRDAYIKWGLAYRVKDAIAPMFQIQFGSFDVGVTYDITVSKLGQMARSGGLEFSVIYTNRDFALFKGRGRF